FTILAIGYAGDSLIDLAVTSGAQHDIAMTLWPTPIGLADVVVTATRAPERAGESGASVSVLSNRELVQRNVTTLDQALAYEPGVTFNAGQMDIRGSSGIARGVGSRVLLLLDGHPILSGDGGEIDFESLPLLDVNRVEVVKGAYTALYGSNAVGGVVTVLTAPVGGRPQTVLRAHYGAFQVPDRHRFTDGTLAFAGLGVQHSRRVGKLGARLFLGRESNDGFQENGESRRWLVRGKLSAPPASAHPWDVYALWVRERDGQFFTWRSDSQPYQVSPDAATSPPSTCGSGIGPPGWRSRRRSPTCSRRSTWT
ncbi:MAG: TonB-dependent receptor, partial [Gemmatimonadales bacterium]